jgi:hypothetical protein
MTKYSRSTTQSNISYLWIFGCLLAVFLVSIITIISLVINYLNISLISFLIWTLWLYFSIINKVFPLFSICLEHVINKFILNRNYYLFSLIFSGLAFVLLMTCYPECTYSLLSGNGCENMGSSIKGSSQPNMGGGPPGGHDGSLVSIIGGHLAQSNTDSSLNSNASFTAEDLKRTSYVEVQNFKNILADKNLSVEERNIRLIELYLAKQREWMAAKLSSAQKYEDITIGLGSSKNK